MTDLEPTVVSLAGLNDVARGRLLLDLYKASLLAKAARLSKAGGPGLLNPSFWAAMAVARGGGPSLEDATAAATRGYVDYFHGASIKADLTSDACDTCLFDRDAGQGAFAAVLRGVRKT
jgi:hypothetical protein